MAGEKPSLPIYEKIRNYLTRIARGVTSYLAIPFVLDNSQTQIGVINIGDLYKISTIV